MAFLHLLSGLFFASDVDALGDTRFAVRNAAHSRLLAAGWPAYPTLVGGLTSPVPERADRCEQLIHRLPGPQGLLAKHTDAAVGGLLASAEPVPELTPTVWLMLRPAVIRAAEDAGPVLVRAWDGSKSFTLSGNFRDWVTRTPWYAGTESAEVRILAEAVRVKRQTTVVSK